MRSRAQSLSLIDELNEVHHKNLSLLQDYLITRDPDHHFLVYLFLFLTLGFGVLLYALISPSFYRDDVHTADKRRITEAARTALMAALPATRVVEEGEYQAVKKQLTAPISKLFDGVLFLHCQYHKPLPKPVDRVDLKPRGFFASILHWWRTSLLERIVEQCQKNLLSLDPPPYTEGLSGQHWESSPSYDSLDPPARPLLD
jgi:hypothetical protein